VWFVSITVFSFLAVLVIVRGFGDLVSLLKGLRNRSTDAAEPAESPK